MPARILIAVAVLGTTGLAVWSQTGGGDPLVPQPIASPPVPPVIRLQPAPLLPGTAVPSLPGPMIAPPTVPAAPRSRDPLLELNDRAGIDDLIRQLRQVREKKDEVERFERQLVSKLQEKVREQNEKLKEMGVAVQAVNSTDE